MAGRNHKNKGSAQQQSQQQQPKKSKRKPRTPNTTMSRQNVKDAPVSVGTPTGVALNNEFLTRTMKETLKHFDKIPETGIIIDALITPDLLTILRKDASTWSKIRYNWLRFGIHLTGPTTTKGSWLAAFVTDPDDIPPVGGSVEDRMTWMRSHRFTSEGKWWETKQIVVKSNRWLFTSDSSEVRTFSPGRFILMNVDAPADDVPLTVNLDWNCSFSVPALQEVDGAQEVRFSPTERLFVQGDNLMPLGDRIVPPPPAGAVMTIPRTVNVPEFKDDWTITTSTYADAIQIDEKGENFSLGHMTPEGTFTRVKTGTHSANILVCAETEWMTLINSSVDFAKRAQLYMTWARARLIASSNGTMRTYRKGQFC